MEGTFKGVKELVIIISLIIFISIVVLYSCEWMECYKVSLTNVFRMNLLCNACNRVTYDLINYQMGIYFAIGTYFVTKMDFFIKDIQTKMSGI